MGAHYSFYVKTIETHARASLTLNILALGRVYSHSYYTYGVDQLEDVNKNLVYVF